MLGCLREFEQAFGRFPAGTVFLVLLVPLDSLLQRWLERHFVLFVPELVHSANSRDTYRAMRNITQLRTMADATKSVKQYAP